MAKTKIEKIKTEFISKKVALKVKDVFNRAGDEVVGTTVYVEDVYGDELPLVADIEYSNRFIAKQLKAGEELFLEATKDTLRVTEKNEVKEVISMHYQVNVTVNELNYNIKMGIASPRYANGQLGNSYLDTKFAELMLALVFGVVINNKTE